MPRGRPKGAKDKQPRKPRIDVPPENREYNENAIRFREIIKPGYMINRNHPAAENIQEIKRRFDNYLKKCIEFNMTPCNGTAYFAMGTSYWSFRDWLSSRNPELQNFAEYVRSYFGSVRDQMMVDGEVHPAVGIFHQKNYDGLKDQQEYVVSANSVLGEIVTEDELARKYLEVADIVPIELESNIVDVVPEKSS